MTDVLLALVYYVAVTPCALLVRAIRRDPLDLRLRTGRSYWKRKEPRSGRLEDYESEF